MRPWRSPTTKRSTLVAREHYGVSDLSVAAQVSRIKASGAQAMIAWGTGTSIGTVFHAVTDANLDIPVAITAGNMLYPILKQFATILPKQLIGSAFGGLAPDSLPRGAEKTAATQYMDAFKAVGVRADASQVIAWDPGWIVVGAYRKLGPNATAAQMKDYLSKVRFVWSDRSIRFPSRSATRPIGGLGADGAVGPRERIVCCYQQIRRRPPLTADGAHCARPNTGEHYSMRRSTMLALTSAAPLAVGPLAAAAQDNDALYAAARREGLLCLAVGGVGNAFVPVASAFMKQYPGITVSLSANYSNVTDLKIDRQLRENIFEVDVAILQTIQDFMAWKRAGELQPFRFDGLAAITPEYKDPDGTWFGLSVLALAYGYNTARVSPADVPRSALDFLKPQFAGQAITCYPHDDDATLYVFSLLEDKYGRAFIERYMASRPEFISGHYGVISALATGAKMVSFDCLTHWALDAKAAGRPIDTVFSPVDQTPLFFIGNAIFRRALHPNAAKLFTLWYASVPAQLAFGDYSARTDVAPPALPSLGQVNVANGYREFLANEPRVMSLRRRYFGYTGPIVNR